MKLNHQQRRDNKRRKPIRKAKAQPPSSHRGDKKRLARMKFATDSWNAPLQVFLRSLTNHQLTRVQRVVYSQRPRKRLKDISINRLEAMTIH